MLFLLGKIISIQFDQRERECRVFQVDTFFILQYYENSIAHTWAQFPHTFDTVALTVSVGVVVFSSEV